MAPMKNTIRYIRVLLIALFLVAAVGASLSLSKPVLLHTHRFTRKDDRSCGGYDEQGTGITVLNPLRSREAEQVADAVFHGLANADCPSEMSVNSCKNIALRKLAPKEWKIAYRTDSGKDVDLFYSWPPEEAATGCRIC
jgi:hypothetical protein